MRSILLTAWLFATALTPAVASSAQHSSLEFTGGRWWNGTRFVPRTLYSVDGVLASVPPAHIDHVYDLAGRFVVPPYADAHVHNLNQADGVVEDIKADLADGVFYAMEMDPAITLSAEVLRRVNLPSSVDVSYSQGLVTPSWGVMPDMYLMLAQAGRFGERKTLAQLDTHEIFIIDNQSDLREKWSKLAAKYHDFIKVIVAFSEEEKVRSKQPSKFGANPPEYSAKAGVTPEVLRALVALAHRSRLRVAAHIETAADFRLALDAGVDVIAHLPAAWQIGPKTGFSDGSLDHWKLTASDARRAAAKGVIVETTIFKAPDDPDFEEYREVYVHNLRLLHRYGARLAVGTDMRASVPEEVLYIASLGVFDNRELLNMLTRSTPQAIFPERKIGRLRDGYEASFLALESNPLDRLESIKRISLRCKQGVVLTPPAATVGTR